MAKQNVTHSCGHSAEHNLFGPGKERDRKISWLETTLCSDCYKAAQQAERTIANIESAQHNTAIGLPSLTGSDKQITWAETIRAKMIDEAYATQSELQAAAKSNNEMHTAIVGMFNDFVARFTAIADAKFWIENRDYSVRSIFNKSPETAEWQAEQEQNKIIRAQIDATAQAERENRNQKAAEIVANVKALAVEIASAFTPVTAELVGRDKIECRDANGNEGTGWIMDGDWVVTEINGVNIGSGSSHADRIGAECRALIG